MIVVKHEVSDELAGSYGVAAVAAKAIIWVAVGLGMYLLPEAARRSHEGIDPRPVLMRTLTLIALAALPMVALYAVAAEPLLRTVFGPDLTGAADALPWLGLAMALLACAYLSVQYLLALRAVELHLGPGRRRGTGDRAAGVRRRQHDRGRDRAVRAPAVLCRVDPDAVVARPSQGDSRRVSMREKWRLFRREKEDPEPFYSLLAREAAADLDRRYGPLRGQRVLDLGCGPGFYTAALRAVGADVTPVDNSEEELALAGGPPEGALIADAGALPLADALGRRGLLLEPARAHTRRRAGDRRDRARAGARWLGATSRGPTGTRRGAATT